MGRCPRPSALSFLNGSNAPNIELRANGCSQSVPILPVEFLNRTNIRVVCCTLLAGCHTFCRRRNDSARASSSATLPSVIAREACTSSCRLPRAFSTAARVATALATAAVFRTSACASRILVEEFRKFRTTEFDPGWVWHNKSMSECWPYFSPAVVVTHSMYKATEAFSTKKGSRFVQSAPSDLQGFWNDQ